MKMNLKKSLFILSLLGCSFVYGETLRGNLFQNGGNFEIKSGSETLRVEATAEILKSLPTLANPPQVVQSNNSPYTFEFNGERNGEAFELSEVPAVAAGPDTRTGLVKYNAATKKFYLNYTKLEFGYTKDHNGYQFDEISKKSFIGQTVKVVGTYKDRVFIAQAITPVNLFNSNRPEGGPPTKKTLKKGIKFALKDMFKNKMSQSEKSFRMILTEDLDNPVVAGDTALIISLSGRQGDTFGSANGHFVVGGVEVQDDLTLKGSVSNIYVTNTKDILAGNQTLTNYFSHFVQGQNQYRPTYTIIVYGISKEKLQTFRNSLESQLITFRTTELPLGPKFNCTTEAVKSLKGIGIKGKHKTKRSQIFDPQNLLFPLKVLEFFGEKPKILSFALRKDKENFLPRPAFYSLLKRLQGKKFRKKHGVKRIDYVFYSQIKSNRPVGGAPLDNPFGAIKFFKLQEKHEADKSVYPLDKVLLKQHLDKIQ